MDRQTRRELIDAIRVRYRSATKEQKQRILDEFVAVTGYHRKHAIRLLAGDAAATPQQPITLRRVYDEAVREALIVIWETSGRIGSKRLKARMPEFIESGECHSQLELDARVRQCLLSMSAATIDRLLAPIRGASQSELAALAAGDRSIAPDGELLDLFLAELPDLLESDLLESDLLESDRLESDQVGPPPAEPRGQPRNWRTRKDPFEDVWSEVLLWLQEDPQATAKSLFKRLKNTYPERRFPKGQLRTFQRRVRQWRIAMAQQQDENGLPDGGGSFEGGPTAQDPAARREP